MMSEMEQQRRAADKKDIMDAVDKRITALEERILRGVEEAVIKGMVPTQEATDKLPAKMETFSVKLGELANDVAGVKKDVKAIKEDVKEAKDDIVKLARKVEEIEAKVDGFARE